MLEQKLIRIQDCPADIFQCQNAIFLGLDMFQAGFHFCLGGRTTHGSLIKTVHDLLIRFLGGNELPEAILFISQLVVDQGSIKELDRHTKIGFRGPFAGTNSLPLWLSKDSQEIVFDQIRRR